MRIFYFIIIAIMFSNYAMAQCADKQNIYSFTYNNTNYEIVKELKNWTDASSCAVERGGYLAEIESIEEQNAIYDAIINGANVASNYVTINNGGGIAYVWIGATDSNQEGTWLWDGNNDNVGINFWNGEGANGNNNGSAVSGKYYNWGGTSTGTVKEPDNYGSDQNCAAIALAGWPSGSTSLGIASEWNDIIGTSSIYYVIEYDMSSSINKNNTNKTKVFPNPVSDNLTILGKNIYEVEIFNITGVKVYNKSYLMKKECNINISSLSKGIYLVKIKTQKDILTRRIIIE